MTEPTPNPFYQRLIEEEGITLRISPAEAAAIRALDMPIRNKLSALYGRIELYFKNPLPEDKNDINSLLTELINLEEAAQAGVSNLNNEEFQPTVRELAPLFSQCIEQTQQILAFMAHYEDPAFVRASLTADEAKDILKKIDTAELAFFIPALKSTFRHMSDLDSDGFASFLKECGDDGESSLEILKQLSNQDLFRLVARYRMDMLYQSQTTLGAHPAYKVYRSITNENDRTGH